MERISKPSKSVAIGRLLRRVTDNVRQRRARTHDPESIINDALRTMKERQIRNRERAVTAITHAGHLRFMYFNQRRVVAGLLKDGRRAMKQKDKEAAARLLNQASQEKKLLRQLGEGLTDASEQVDHIKRAIREEESTFRKATARALAMKSLIELATIERELQTIDAEIEREYGVKVPPKGPDRSGRSMGSRRAH